MKKIILPLAAAIVLMSTGCTKENISRLQDVVNNGADDHGGNSGGGGGGDDISSSSVPDSVMVSFNGKYPGAAVIEWKKLDNGNFKVEFTLDGDKFEVTFSPSGDLLKEERD
jgi:hypothetical protein